MSICHVRRRLYTARTHPCPDLSKKKDGADVTVPFSSGLPQRPFGMGLDLSSPDTLTSDERAAYSDYYRDFLGRPHLGLQFWLDEGRPGPLKRTRMIVEQIQDPSIPKQLMVESIAWLVLYSSTGWVDGVRYVVHSAQRRGMTKSLVFEYLAVAFLWVGPRGMECIRSALDGFQWITPARELVLPAGWASDPAAFDAGLDFDSPALSPGELRSLREWYLDQLGEIPRYVEFLARWRPELLKAQRNRFEHAIDELPKQVMPCAMILVGMLRRSEDGLREGALLARRWGVAREHVLQLVCAFLEYGGSEELSMADEVLSPLLEDWPTS